MSANFEKKSAEGRAAFRKEIDARVARKIKVQRHPAPGVWFGLGTMGLVGWSVAVPTLLGSAMGLWLDKHDAGKHSWTLALLVVGLAIGCGNAWHWVDMQAKAMQEEQEEQEDHDE